MKHLNLQLTLLLLVAFAGINFNATAQGNPDPQPFIWNGSVSSDWDNPNNWTPNAIPTATSEITIPLTDNLLLISGVKAVEDLIINSDASLIIPVGATLNVNGDLDMYSESNSYASLIVNGTIVISGTAKYHRFTNSQSNGNDLVAPPLSGQTWSSFLTSDSNYNEGLIFNNGLQPTTTYLFGPFEKGTTDDYLLYDDNSLDVLVSGKGYRTATTTVNGDTLTFTGTIVTGSVNSIIENDMTGEYSEWNLIGNPYPAYIEVDAFLNHVGSVSGVSNLSLLNASTAAIYGYNANTAGSENNWTIANLASGETLIAPGQGFFVSSSSPIANLEFTPDMQVVGKTDDFIQGRSSESINFVKVRMQSGADFYTTSIYFHENGSNGLDIGYDAAIFENILPDFLLYSHLVENNEDLSMVIQTLNSSVIDNASISLGVNANQSQQVTFSIEDSYLPMSVNVYLEDNLNGTSTLLNTSNYTFTTNTTINVTGRFFLHFTTEETMSLAEASLKDLRVSTNQTNRTIVIEGILPGETEVSVYDLLGRKVIQQNLDTAVNKQIINTSMLNSGLHIVQLQNGNQKITKKVILK
ncbi:T9SS type A sorting domain-containing protein [Psychroserpens mesophilus]|uniref:T9SS type A sorting domain-containing protein n=1 Tax=Psychroserpens mesophilus TaxID=325473 RepID=UPI003D65B1B6